MNPASPCSRRWPFVAAALALLAACATDDYVTRRPVPLLRPLPGPSVDASQPSGAPDARNGASEPTSLVLLRLRQTFRDVPSVPPRALWPWLAAIDKAEPFHRVDSDPLPAALAADGWLAWRLPAGAYQLVVSGYATNGLPPRINLDRYRFVVPSPGLALYLGSSTYACEPAWWFEALCPGGPIAQDDLAAAGPVAAALGATSVTAARFERVLSTSPRTPGSDPSTIPSLDLAHTLLVAGEGQAVRAVHDYLAQTEGERGASLQVGAAALVELAPYGPAAILALPLAAATELGLAIRREVLTRKMQCLQRIWDERVDHVARGALEAALRAAVFRAGPGGEPASADSAAVPLARFVAADRRRHLLALDVQRLAIEACHPSAPWLPDPRATRFCLEVAVRARVWAPGAREPVSDEVFSVVPERRVGHEFEPTGWPIPPPYLYETRLQGPVEIHRTTDEYCGPDGFALVQSDLRRIVQAIVPAVLAAHGIGGGTR